MIEENNSLIEHLDLRGTPCPLNFVRCNLTLEKLNNQEFLQVDIDRGEPEETIISGLSKSGHNVKIIYETKEFLTLLINRLDS
ncbi:sulfurtransferase TusA family protein [Prochlorococcus sp. MIT 1223]|uniref:sulfurtransferase TusA family protein n=1 Tax=Prochlorococcus sp. MIT 1223 TaxID=3096217 RepID=UPI002A751EF4|nr:sulfurtransferase TusA family protein [Prochlorococcus sp. MIT 1223]